MTGDSPATGSRARYIHHPGIVVADLERAIEFYCAFLDLEPVYEEEWGAADDAYNQGVGLIGSAAKGVHLRGANSYLELWEYRQPGPAGPPPAELGANEPGFRHLAIEVDDVPSALAELESLGGTRMNDPVDLGDGFAVYARDPFGNIIELMDVAASIAEAGEQQPRSVADL